MINACGKVLVKLVIFTVEGGKLMVLLSPKKLPSGELNKREFLDQVAKEFFRKTAGFSPYGIYLEQLYTFSYPKKERVEIDVVYYFLVPGHDISQEKIKTWYVCSEIPKTNPDSKIVSYAIQRLRWKIEYTNVVYSLLPDEFTFGELQTVYEAILGRSLDKRNFRKKILSLNLLQSTGRIKNLGRARPAEMFSFRKKKLTFVEIL